ncbi:hypothetical protein FWF48_03220, partial [Candidatus Saccharibacteria bacterium]|nr:hypothetical protein [Candidatus Saccharibacteria bacterium]
MRIAKKISYLIFGLPIILSLVFAVVTCTFFQPKTAEALAAADPSTIPGCNGNSECFAFTINTKLDAQGGLTNTGLTFAIPTNDHGGGGKPYNWLVNWGDGNIEPVSGTSSSSGVSAVAHTYASAGQYQITIQPNGTPQIGWFDAFGAFITNLTNNPSSVIYQSMFLSIDTMLTNLMRTNGVDARFSFMFYGMYNAIGIPANLFTNVSTAGDVNLGMMFDYTFADFARNSTTATIPAGLFDFLDTSQADDFVGMFENTFMNFAQNSTVGTIPAGLFDSMDTRNGMFFLATFNGTFNNYAQNSTVGTIPAGLFSSINTDSGIVFPYMFLMTFEGYAMDSTVGTVPADLFDTIDTSKASGTDSTFNVYSGTFGRVGYTGYANRSATFKDGSTIVDSQTMDSSSVLYSVKNISTDSIPTDSPTINPGDIIVPTYDNNDRTITVPTGTDANGTAYADYDWYRTDGTSCSVAHPTPDCGIQNTSTLVTFPNSTEWT